MFIVFAQHIGPRLEYIAKTLLGEKTIITRDIHKFNNSSLQKINYSTTKFDESLWIVPSGLLEQSGFQQQYIVCFEWEGIKAFYKTGGNLPFDFFSAAFYLISRYEEYEPNHQKDTYGNYHHTNSLAFKEGFLSKPLIDLWIMKIQEKRPEWGVFLAKKDEKANFLPTYDIDIAFAYKHHSILKTIFSLAKSLVGFKRIFIEQVKVLARKKQDPFDVFSWLMDLHEKHMLKPVYFFLFAKKRSNFDKNSSISSKKFKKQVELHSKKYSVGIHPSFSSNKSTGLLQSEIKSLEAIIQKKVYSSRQHYLQLKFPETYKRLINQGITNDYTMGYGTSNGFRASYTKPFYWYDITEEKQTSLLLHPFCYMDANSIFEQKLLPEQALTEMLYYHQAVKEVNGTCIFIMHNHFLANQKEWQPWREAYENFLKTIDDGK